MAAKKKNRSLSKGRRKSKYDESKRKTLAMRSRCPKDLVPLFDHMVKLSESAKKQSEEPGRAYLAKRAGQDLLAARRLVEKHEK